MVMDGALLTPRRHAALRLILLSICVCCIPIVHSQSTTFTSTSDGKELVTYNFPTFDNSLLRATNLTIRNNASISQGALQITPDSSNNAAKFLVNQTGRIFFSTPFNLWDSNSSSNTTAYVASFSTVFKLNIFQLDETSIASIPGEGFAFLIAPNLDPPPPASHGGFLGLTNSSTDGSTANQFVAVEFDTVKQPYDPDNNHVGLDINGVHSIATTSLTPLGIQLPSRNSTNHMVWIDYDGTSRHIWVYMATEGKPKPTSAVLNSSLDLSTVIPQKAYFGFSASTGEQFELNCVLMWNLTVETLNDNSAKKGLPRWKLGLFIGIPCAFAALLAGLLASLRIREMRRKVGADPRAVFNTSIDVRSLPGIPKEFDYKELRKGTDNFDETKKLGQGGYGVVYKATVLGDNGKSMEVAVKQFSGANTKGQEDFLAELGIINRLRHRNLVKLVGWCHQNGVLLLVYDYMPNGSLDKHLFGGPEAPILTWEQRYNIITDVASALNYLHHEYDQMVLHRDIKPSNIMLDSAFNARLGDFGLARALETDKTSYTSKIGVPGTLGYIAPECFHTGKATRESDVFAFGAVLLEIVCGRRLSCNNPAGCSQLLEWVWKLHGACRIVEAVDPRLGDDFDETDAERLLLLGLACSHPNPGERPKTQAIVQILSRSVRTPAVPMSKPVFMWPALPVVHLDDDGETRSYSGMTSTVVTSSYYASSSGWTQNQVSKENSMG